MSDERVRRDGDRVIRPRERWTPAVHLALRHLRDHGFLEAPAPLALDEEDETLQWIDGASGADGWAQVVPESGLTAMARMLRRAHRAGTGFVLPDELSWADRSAPRSGETICHGDPGPWNIAWRDGEPVGLFDWDLARSGDPLDDVAYALEYVAPFRDDEEATVWLGYPAPPDRPARIDVFWRAYSEEDGPVPRERLVDSVIRQQRATTALASRLAAEGIEPQATWFRAGHGEELEQRIRWSERNRDALIGR